ncbi:MAG: hypothetical protein ACPHQP_11855 [Longimicrobiales bacterium]
MPVFTRLGDDVLTLTVDGDYTANELRRVAFAAFESEESPSRFPILLDMSGAAGVMSKSDEEMKAAGAIFGAYRDRIAGLGIVVAADAHGRFATDSLFAEEAGLPVHPCHSHADARAWFSGENSD